MTVILKGDLVKAFQEYIDDSPIESDDFLEGLDITEPDAVDLFNDFIMFCTQSGMTNISDDDLSEALVVSRIKP